jgi:hypothetical protein
MVASLLELGNGAEPGFALFAKPRCVNNVRFNSDKVYQNIVIPVLAPTAPQTRSTMTWSISSNSKLTSFVLGCS